MQTPSFLSLDEVVEIHADQIRRYGGTPGIRDLGMLSSAVSVPAATYGGRYLHQDLAEMAAAYLFHVVQDHPFLDGNKRTGAVCALVFLEINGVECEFDEDVLAELVENVAAGKTDKATIVGTLKAAISAGDPKDR